MGIYLNPNNENFRRTLAGDIYVDKTMMLSVINTYIDKGKNYICISRPRRFGKTVAGNMISAYYSKGCDSREMFSGLKIAKTPEFSEKLNKFNVIQLDMNSEYQNVKKKDRLIQYICSKLEKEIESEFPQIAFNEDEPLSDRILKVYNLTGETFIIILDEYDVLVREQASPRLFNEYLGFLNGLFKSNTLKPAISLAYITGILPVVRDKIQSKLNNFKEYTLLNSGDFSEFIGFTSDEVRSLCEKYSIDYEECKSWYDGYSQNGYEIYNPESVVTCITDRYFDNYWGKTSTYKVISEQLQRNFKGTKECVIRMLGGESVDVNVTSYLNTMDSFASRNDVFTYLIHVGYLAYDRDTKTCRIPNREIRQEWNNAVEVDDEYSVTNEIIEASKELLSRTLQGDAKAVEEALDLSHIHVTSNRSYNNEDALQSAIYLAYIYAQNKYHIFKELTTGKGFADVVFVPFITGIPAMIVELKHNRSAETALNQIKEKKYFTCLSNYKGEILFVGINYDEKEKTHKCKIETMKK